MRIMSTMAATVTAMFFLRAVFPCTASAELLARDAERTACRKPHEVSLCGWHGSKAPLLLHRDMHHLLCLAGHHTMSPSLCPQVCVHRLAHLCGL